MRAARAVVLGLMIVVGCRQSALSDVGPRSGDAGASARISPAALCGALAEAVCDADAPCCAGIERSACLDAQTGACERTIGALAGDPRAGYSATSASSFLDGLRAEAEGCFAVGPELTDLRDVFEGTGVAGADCSPRDAARASLRLSALSCARGLACRLYLRTGGTLLGVCEPRDDLEVCTHPFDCASGRWCDMPPDWEPGRTGRCAPLRADGWDCARDAECASGLCEPSASGRTCVAHAPRAYCTSVSYEQAVLADAPEGYWRLGDARASAKPLDSSPHRAAGTYVGEVALSEEGAIAGDGDGALELRGDGAHARLAPGVDGAIELSMECWFRVRDVASTRPILELVGETRGPHIWNHDTGDKIYVNALDVDAASHRVMSDAGAVTAGAWHHIVATYDETKVVLYLDGVAIGEVPSGSELPSGMELVVGFRDGDSRVFRGAIDEVAIYGRALSAARVHAHYALGRSGPAVVPFRVLQWLE